MAIKLYQGLSRCARKISWIVMTRGTRLLVSIVGLSTAIAGLSAAAAQDDHPADAYWYCHTVQDANPIYVTAVWETKAIPVEVRAAFGRVLDAKYGHKGLVMCSIALKGAPMSSLAKSETDAKGQIAYWRKQGKTVVETGWTNSQPSPAPNNWGACHATVITPGGTAANGPFETYVSSAFPAGAASTKDLEAKFRAFLLSKYALKDAKPRCTLAATESSASSSLGLWTLDTRRRGGKIIETGWKG
jgi:hypothetical protein